MSKFRASSPLRRVAMQALVAAALPCAPFGLIVASATGTTARAAETPAANTASYRVAATTVHTATRLVTVRTGKATIHATPEHPIYVERQGFIRAEDVRRGDLLRLASGSLSAVTEDVVVRQAEAGPVYNMTVEGAHTFFVGEEAALAHNVGGCSAGLAGGLASRAAANRVSVRVPAYVPSQRSPMMAPRMARDARRPPSSVLVSRIGDPAGARAAVGRARQGSVKVLAEALRSSAPASAERSRLVVVGPFHGTMVPRGEPTPRRIEVPEGITLYRVAPDNTYLDEKYGHQIAADIFESVRNGHTPVETRVSAVEQSSKYVNEHAILAGDRYKHNEPPLGIQSGPHVAFDMSNVKVAVYPPGSRTANLILKPTTADQIGTIHTQAFDDPATGIERAATQAPGSPSVFMKFKNGVDLETVLRLTAERASGPKEVWVLSCAEDPAQAATPLRVAHKNQFAEPSNPWMFFAQGL